MSARILVAGVGNVFFRDDGFGVEVAHHLAREALPEAVAVTDYGIRGLHLAYELLDPPALLIVIDLAPRGSRPGTLYVLEPDLRDLELAPISGGHGVDLRAVFARVLAMGGRLPRSRIVGCEPADVGEGMGLTAAVRSAVPRAAATVRKLIALELLHGPEDGTPEEERSWRT